jgi:hypothetical protein
MQARHRPLPSDYSKDSMVKSLGGPRLRNMQFLEAIDKSVGVCDAPKIFNGQDGKTVTLRKQWKNFQKTLISNFEMDNS